VRFSIAAQYNGKPTTITGTLSYTLLEHDCATGKVAIADISTVPAIPPTTVSFDQNLSFGMRSAAVSTLQQFLVSRVLLSSDSVTGYFGPKTLAAVKALQSQQGIVPVSGFFGPLTRAKANAIVSGTAY
jgi:peptidoglycan hydrolase-like protein with peptidoglycan-binding domain